MRERTIARTPTDSHEERSLDFPGIPYFQLLHLIRAGLEINRYLFFGRWGVTECESPGHKESFSSSRWDQG